MTAFLGLILKGLLLKHSGVCRPLQRTYMHFISLDVACAEIYWREQGRLYSDVSCGPPGFEDLSQ